MQAVCHGDAKGANILYCTGEGGEAVPLVYDFQYCGKGCVAKDLAYFFNVQASASEEQAPHPGNVPAIPRPYLGPSRAISAVSRPHVD